MLQLFHCNPTGYSRESHSLLALADGDGSDFQNACKNSIEFKIQSKLSHLVDWVNAQTSSGTATNHFHRRLSSNSGDSFATGDLGAFYFGFGWGFFKSFFKTHTKFVR